MVMFYRGHLVLLSNNFFKAPSALSFALISRLLNFNQGDGPIIYWGERGGAAENLLSRRHAGLGLLASALSWGSEAEVTGREESAIWSRQSALF